MAATMPIYTYPTRCFYLDLKIIKYFNMQGDIQHKPLENHMVIYCNRPFSPWCLGELVEGTL